MFALIGVIGCALDLLTKHLVFLKWPPGGDGLVDWWLVPGYVGIQTAINHGALFGLGQGLVGLFSALSVVAAIAILLWLTWGGAAKDRLLTIALGSVMAGIFGNLYDRLGLWGGTYHNGERIYAVRDWILLQAGEHRWPNFNVADMLLVAGALLLIWHAFQGKPEKSESDS